MGNFRSKFQKTQHAVSLFLNDRSGVAQKVKAQKLTYLSHAKLLNILRAIDRLEKTRVPGIFVEAGCALGGSTVVIGNRMGPERRMQVYDTFAMIPPPSDEDPEEARKRYDTIKSGKSQGIGGNAYYGYMDNLKDQVSDRLTQFLGPEKAAHIQLIEGLLQDTMRIEGPVAFAHVDVDWYDPVKYCLTHLWPRLSVGGVIILDDYFDWGGCAKATDEFLQTVSDHDLDRSLGSLVITRTG